jgi:SAM-dependent methyltransferase
VTRFLWQDREADYVYPFSTRPECMALIQRPPEVALDIGCGSGGVGYALRQRYPACQLWGCELDASAAAQARRHFDHVIEQDAQAFDFSSLGLVRPFDLICLFDVLEHLTNPWKLLQGLHRIAAPDAHVLVSLPNVGNIALLHDALKGHWRYRSWGLLDFTHLRFFTDFDARAMFHQTGYRVLDHRIHLLGAGTALHAQHRDQSFPRLIAFGHLSLYVETVQAFDALCADQNLYVITPRRDPPPDDRDAMPSAPADPPVLAYGGG